MSASTRVDPLGLPTRRAEGNTENARTNVRMNVVASPGASSGSVMRRNRFHQPAPRVRPAASSDGSMPDR